MATIPTVSGISVIAVDGNAVPRPTASSSPPGSTASRPRTRRRNFEATALRFLEALAGRAAQGARSRTCARRSASLTANCSAGTGRQYVLRIKSLLSYAHRLGYTPFNAGVVLKVKSAARGAQLAKRILPEVDVKLLIRAARTERDRVLLSVGYGGGLRVSELVGLKWGDVIARDKQVQLSVLGKGGRRAPGPAAQGREPAASRAARRRRRQ